jgi:8-oxo-dGTP pyrophosphatase MutT (NUDIX family)
MEPDLAAFLARHQPGPTEAAAWLDGALRLRLTSYLSNALPPLTYVNSVRCLIFQGDRVLVLTNQHSRHIVPGGRREPGEALLATLRREVLEETGWSVTAPVLLGFTYFHVSPPRPPDYAYPHAGFINVVYHAEAVTHDPAAPLLGDYETAAEFVPVAVAWTLPLSAGEQFFLAAALDRRPVAPDRPEPGRPA